MESMEVESGSTSEPGEVQVSKRTRTKRCGNTAHTDVIVRSYRARDGSPEADTATAATPRVKCTTCGDVFPCRDTECGHLDCGWVRSGECQISEFSRAAGCAAPRQVEAQPMEASHATD